LKAAGLDAMGNALVNLENQFPFNLGATNGAAQPEEGDASALFGIGRIAPPPLVSAIAGAETAKLAAAVSEFLPLPPHPRPSRSSPGPG
jgi:hypothetical protein